MGRGRAKAKQTKVARQLKYQTLGTDFDALQRELGGTETTLVDRPDVVDDQDDEDDPYAAYAAPDDGTGIDEDQPAPGRR
jgi:hypothetical protein